MKKILLLCLVAVSTVTLFSFKADAPVLASHITGNVYDQNDHSSVEGILVEEIINGKAVSRQYTDSRGYFGVSVQTTSSTATLRFTDPDYGTYSEQTESFDLRSSSSCESVSVYMSSQQTE